MNSLPARPRKRVMSLVSREDGMNGRYGRERLEFGFEVAP